MLPPLSKLPQLTVRVHDSYVQKLENDLPVPLDSLAQRSVIGHELIDAVHSTHVLIIVDDTVQLLDTFTTPVHFAAVHHLPSVNS